VHASVKLSSSSSASTRWRAAIATSSFGSRGVSIAPPPRARIKATRSPMSSRDARELVKQLGTGRGDAAASSARRPSALSCSGVRATRRGTSAATSASAPASSSAAAHDSSSAVRARSRAGDVPQLERGGAPRMGGHRLDLARGIRERADRREALCEACLLERGGVVLGERGVRRGGAARRGVRARRTRSGRAATARAARSMRIERATQLGEPAESRRRGARTEGAVERAPEQLERARRCGLLAVEREAEIGETERGQSRRHARAPTRGR